MDSFVQQLIDVNARVKMSPLNIRKKRSASYDRYSKYRMASTIQEIVALGGSRKDVAYDLNKGMMTLMERSLREELETVRRPTCRVEMTETEAHTPEARHKRPLIPATSEQPRRRRRGMNGGGLDDIEEVLEDPTFASVADALASIEVPVNESRINVRSSAEQVVTGMCLGVVCARGNGIAVGAESRRRPNLTHSLVRFAKKFLPEFNFTSIQVQVWSSVFFDTIFSKRDV